MQRVKSLREDIRGQEIKMLHQDDTYGAGHVIRWSEIDVFLATMSSVKLLCPSLTLQDT